MITIITTDLAYFLSAVQVCVCVVEQVSHFYRRPSDFDRRASGRVFHRLSQESPGTHVTRCNASRSVIHAYHALISDGAELRRFVIGTIMRIC